jgi:choline dehydrogenase-like flavoprotein
VIYDALELPLPLRLKADLCIVGTGPGGATAGMLASEAGMRVVLLEAGARLSPDAMTQREEAMIPELYWDSGARATSDLGVRVHQGKGVGGSSLHNLGLCKRIPERLLEEWHVGRPLEELPVATWRGLYAEVEAMLGVQLIPEQLWNRHNQLLRAGSERLGWAGGGLSHNRSGCIGSGYCDIGCRYDAKNNAAKICVPRAVRASAEIVSHCFATRILHEREHVTGVEATVLEPGTRYPRGSVEVEAPLVCLAASATGTPALLERSRVPDPGREAGRRLYLHPGVMAIGDFPEPVHAWRGIPQTYECTELLDFSGGGHRLWIVPAFAHPMAASTLLPGFGKTHRDWMLRYPHLGAFSAMLHDQTPGQVRASGTFDLAIDYWPNEADQRELMTGLWAVTHLLFAAGAERVLIPSSPARVLERGQPYDELKSQRLECGRLDVASVHPMGSVPMGDDPAVAAVASSGAHHHLRGLFIADASLFPSSIGVPPQLSTYALGLHVGRSLIRAAAR